MVLPIEIAIVTFVLLAIRETALLITYSAIAKRVGEKGLVMGCFIYDKIEPITQTILAIARKISPPAGLWV